MRNLPRSAQIYITVVFCLGVLIALSSMFVLTSDFWGILYALLVSFVIAGFDLKPVQFQGHHYEVLPSTAIKLAGVILCPPPLILTAVFLGTLWSELRFKRAWYKLIFNVGELTVTYVIVVLAYRGIVPDPNAPILGSAAGIVALMLMGIVDVIVNSTMIAHVIALSEREPITFIWFQTFRPLLLNDLSMLPIGVFIALLWRAAPVSSLLAIAPLLVARRAYQTAVDLETQTREALQALARVLDERDEATANHCELVAHYAEGIAHELKLGPDEVDIIIRAAWLHDIGKVGMRNQILFKSGALTRDERAEAQRHALIGGNLLTKFPLFKKGAVYVRHHHEWWDGTGYPDRLAGEEIPLGARILAVADAYQAMTGDRSYRQAMSEEAALAELRVWSGTQFDPTVVQAFFKFKGIPVPGPEVQPHPEPQAQPQPARLNVESAGSPAE